MWYKQQQANNGGSLNFAGKNPILRGVNVSAASYSSSLLRPFLGNSLEPSLYTSCRSCNPLRRWTALCRITLCFIDACRYNSSQAPDDRLLPHAESGLFITSKIREA